MPSITLNFYLDLLQRDNRVFWIDAWKMAYFLSMHVSSDMDIVNQMKPLQIQFQ